jgi:hypothetical protein
MVSGNVAGSKRPLGRAALRGFAVEAGFANAGESSFPNG